MFQIKIHLNYLVKMIKALENFFHNLKENIFFNVVVFIVIIFAAVIAGMETFSLNTTLEKFISNSDYFISIFFISEILIRILGEKHKLNFFKDAWNSFDFIIVCVSLVPIDGFGNLIVARLVRVFRVLRLVTHVPQFKILINALLISIPRVLYVIGLMFIIFYIYAVIGSFMFAEIDPDRWGNLFLSLWTLFQVSTLEGWPDIMLIQFNENAMTWIYFFTFIILIAMILMNMIVGVIIDVIVQENETEIRVEKEILEKLKAIEKKLENL